jgi:hypothetical protein
MERNCLYIDKTAYVIVPLDGAKLLVMINFLNGEQKTLPAARRPAARVDFVPVAGSVRVPQNLLCGNKVNSIDFGG